MTRRVAEAAQGTGEAKQAIIDLGLNAQELVTAGPYQAMMKIADALSKVENQAEQVRLAFKLFDSEGVSLVNMLRDGSGALADFTKEAEKFGAVMSESVSQNIADAKTELDKFAAIQQGFEQSKAGASKYSPRPGRSLKAWWQQHGPTRMFYNMINDDTGTYADIERKAAKAAEEQAKAEAQKAAALKKSADYTKKVKDAQNALLKANYLRDEPARIAAEIAKLEAKAAALNPPEPESPSLTTTMFRPEAREIDTSRVSIAGLAMSGRETVLTETKKQTNLLQDISRNTRKIANEEVLN